MCYLRAGEEVSEFMLVLESVVVVFSVLNFCETSDFVNVYTLLLP